jgi:diguanylate cyclase (GGDEF)-like protein
LRAAIAQGNWAIARVPRIAAAYLLLVDAAVAVWAGFALSSIADAGGRDWFVLGLLLALAIGFEESATRTARIQRRISGQLKRNMTSVWTVAGAIALPTPLAVLLVLAVVVHIWFRQQRPVGHQLYRSWFTASTQVATCLVSIAALRAWAPNWEHLGWALGGSLSVLIVIAIQTAVNRGLVTIAFLTTGVRGKILIGSRDDNLIEFATLCLGGLVALAAAHEPWLCILVVAPMVTLQRGALVRELETAATTDAKTGLLNAVAWEHLAQRELARAAREGYEVAVLIIDIDRFKLVNDLYGHLVGDQVLRTVGKVLAAEVREYDTVGRFGGEEFVAVLPMAGDADALVVAERLRSRINELRVAPVAEGVELAGAADHALAVSIGVACSGADGTEVSDLLVAADSALYRAKAGGRNRVVLADRGAGGPSERLRLA